MLIHEQFYPGPPLFQALQVQDSSARGHFLICFFGFFTYKQNPTFYFPIKPNISSIFVRIGQHISFLLA